MNTESNSYLYIFRGGADPNQMSPEDMQKNMDAWFAWMEGCHSPSRVKVWDGMCRACGVDGAIWL